jgi:hypothetical protein
VREEERTNENNENIGAKGLVDEAKQIPSSTIS